MRRLLFALSIVLMSSTVAPAMVISEEAFVCPVDNAPFTQMIPISGFAASIMLDFQQRGAIASPSPMPVCPGSGFVMFKQAFSPDEIQRIKEMVEYKLLDDVQL